MTFDMPHSPLPWKVREDHGVFMLRSADHMTVALMTANAISDGDDGSSNAALIVTAVNAHADFLAALKACKSAIESAVYDEDGLDGLVGQRVIELILAAIAKAETRR